MNVLETASFVCFVKKIKKGCKKVLEVKAKCGEKKLERENNIPKNVV